MMIPYYEMRKLMGIPQITMNLNVNFYISFLLFSMN